MSTILVTGSSGFTGRHLINAAFNAGFSCIGLQRTQRSNSDYNVIVADITNQEQLKAALGSVEIDYVIHLAAISFVGHDTLSQFYQHNLIGTLNLLESLKATQSHIKKVLIASSANVYGNNSQLPISESLIPDPINDYAASKFAMEIMLKQRFSELPIDICRPFNYTGVGQQEHFLIPKIFKAHAQRLPVLELGNLDVARDYSDVRDVCNAYLKLLDSPVTGQIFNVCSGQSTNLQELIRRISKLTGFSSKIEINQSFVRANEIKNLYGDDSKLRAVIGDYRHYDLNDTLTWMWRNYYGNVNP